MTKIIWRTNWSYEIIKFVRNKKKNMRFLLYKNACFLKGCLLFYTCYLTDKLEFAVDRRTTNYSESDSLQQSSPNGMFGHDFYVRRWRIWRT